MTPLAGGGGSAARGREIGLAADPLDLALYICADGGPHAALRREFPPMFDTTDNDPISPAMRALLEVFSTELAEVKFPDVDAEVLEEGAHRVRAQADAVAQAQAALEAARQALAESQEALLQKGQRALAYARVFSEEDAELSTKLEAISLPRVARKGVRTESAVVAEAPAQGDDAAPRRRGRPPKARPSAPLFSEGGSPEAVEAAEASAPVRPAPPVPGARPVAA